jgi:hypothetical protein
MPTTISITMSEPAQRRCGGCSLCCKLLPVRELRKKANERCQHQRFKKGCALYGRPTMPPSCQVWNCRWLVNNDTAELSRPDRSHYVIDLMPDFVTLRDNNNNNNRTHIEVVQIWVDPAHRDAWRDPHLLAYLERRGREGVAALLRFGPGDVIGLFPPSMSEDQQWHEIHDGECEPEHTIVDVIRAAERTKKKRDEDANEEQGADRPHG